MRYVNLGCGSRYHPDWVNIDIVPCGQDILVHDVIEGIPLPDANCDVVYHSNLLEHIRRAEALPFMKECYRVLKAGGILRVAVPDLERVCKLYLEKLEAASKGSVLAKYDYEWIILEMYDQAVREHCGGDMSTYLSQAPLPNEEFVYKRIGEEMRKSVSARTCSPSGVPQFSWYSGLRRWVRILRFLPAAVRRYVLLFLLGRNGMKALEVGRFRFSGEVHHWMYERYSLAQLMLAAGFKNPVQQSPAKSLIPHWSSFDLDTLPDGTVIKPDSLFMEAIKPVET